MSDQVRYGGIRRSSASPRSSWDGIFFGGHRQSNRRSSSAGGALRQAIAQVDAGSLMVHGLQIGLHLTQTRITDAFPWFIAPDPKKTGSDGRDVLQGGHMPVKAQLTVRTIHATCRLTVKVQHKNFAYFVLFFLLC